MNRWFVGSMKLKCNCQKLFKLGANSKGKPIQLKPNKSLNRSKTKSGRDNRDTHRERERERARQREEWEREEWERPKTGTSKQRAEATRNRTTEAAAAVITTTTTLPISNIVDKHEVKGSTGSVLRRTSYLLWVCFHDFRFVHRKVPGKKKNKQRATKEWKSPAYRRQ